MLGRLDDGTFVWATRHEDGTISVLGARDTYDAYRLLGVPALKSLVVWQPVTRRFELEAYDEYGVGRGGYPNLPRYESEIDEAQGLIRVGAEAQPLARGRMEPIADHSAARAETPPAARPRFVPLSLEEALRLPDGMTALVDASLVFRPDRPPRLCPSSHAATARCPPNAPEPAELASIRLRPDSSFDGPLAVRIKAGHPVEVTLAAAAISHGTGY
jgi:hypothetical protein